LGNGHLYCEAPFPSDAGSPWVVFALWLQNKQQIHWKAIKELTEHANDAATEINKSKD